jgi:dTDP-4-amino-4,6-dideoxygalactose transaminase
MKNYFLWSINMIPLFKVGMSSIAVEKVTAVLNSGFIGQGPVVEEFEDELWKWLGCKTRPVTVNSCTAAIDLALDIIGIKPGDEVIATPQTCFASNVGAIHRGARIRWADIDPLTGLIDPESVNKLVNPKTKAILAVNWAGKFCDYKALKATGVPVIEDAAHCWDVHATDRLERGDYICYSFQAIKFLTTGDGGILICPPETENEARTLRWYGLDRTKNESFRCTQDITKVGFKYHMNDINASIGLSNLGKADYSVACSRRNAKEYISKIKNPLLVLPEWDHNCSYWLFSMHVKPGLKDHFTQYLTDNLIASSPVHFRNDLYSSITQFREGDLPGVTAFTETQICIPNGWWLNLADTEHIIKTLNAYTGK